MTARQLQMEYNLTDEQTQMVYMVCEEMPHDVDSIWAMLQDEGIDINYEDLSEICDNYL